MQYVPFGRITAGFRGYSPKVAESVGHNHTGIDTYRGYGTPVIAQNEGYVYKVYKPTNDFTWAAVYMLVPTEDPDVEIEWIPLGHASAVAVEEGEVVQPETVVGQTGNHGLVYSGGRKVTVRERQEGSRDGTHNHQQGRPVRKVKNIDRGKHYLRMQDGSPYLDANGYYRQIIHTNNVKGCVDPMSFYPKKLGDVARLYIQDFSAQKKSPVAELNLLKMPVHMLYYVAIYIKQFTR